jgi:hypothetical protein
MDWVPQEEQEAPWQHGGEVGSQAPGFRVARDGEPMCESCKDYDGNSRMCERFGMPTEAFRTCDAYEQNPEMMRTAGGPMPGGPQMGPGPMPGGPGPQMPPGGVA